MAACSAPLVGMLAEDWFGFRGTSKVTGNRKADLHNAKALGSALLAFTTGGRRLRVGMGRTGRCVAGLGLLSSGAVACSLALPFGACPLHHPPTNPSNLLLLLPQCPGSSAS